MNNGNNKWLKWEKWWTLLIIVMQQTEQPTRMQNTTSHALTGHKLFKLQGIGRGLWRPRPRAPSHLRPIALSTNFFEVVTISVHIIVFEATIGSTAIKLVRNEEKEKGIRSKSTNTRWSYDGGQHAAEGGSIHMASFWSWSKDDQSYSRTGLILRVQMYHMRNCVLFALFAWNSTHSIYAQRIEFSSFLLVTGNWSKYMSISIQNYIITRPMKIFRFSSAW